MENDTTGVPGYGRRAWAGHSADTGSDEVAEPVSQELDLLREGGCYGDLQLVTSYGGVCSNEHALWR